MLGVHTVCAQVSVLMLMCMFVGQYIYICIFRALINWATRINWHCMHTFENSRVKGNDKANRLAGKPTITSGLRLGRSEMLRSLRHYLQAQSQYHHNIDHLEERDVKRGSARRSSLKGREKAIVNQTNIGTVLKATSGKLLRRDGAYMGFSERFDTILS